MSAPTSSQIIDKELIDVIRCAKNAFDAILDNSAEKTPVSIILLGGTQCSYKVRSLATASLALVVFLDPIITRSGFSKSLIADP